MLTPRFSIVIPTRERAEVLKYALQTCLAQQFDDYEIVVSDNCSSEATRNTVKSFNSPKIKYFRSDEPLSLTDSLELAVSKASGEYIIVIGDDDGILSYALKELNRLFSVFKTKILTWNFDTYSWPNVTIPGKENKLRIPFPKENYIAQSHKVVSSVVNCRVDFNELPKLYHKSAVHRDLLNLLRQKTGRVFKTHMPDIYSGFAIAYLVKKYIVLGCPMTIPAASKWSTGFSTLKNPDGFSDSLYVEIVGRFKCHPNIPDLPLVRHFFISRMVDTFFHAKDALFPNDFRVYIDRKQLIRNCLVDVMSYKWDSDKEFQTSLKAIRDSLADNKRLQRWFDRRLMKDISHLDTSKRREIIPEPGFHKDILCLDASKFNVFDIFGAVELTEKILGERKEWVMCSERVRPLGLAALRGRLDLYRRLRSAARILLKGSAENLR